MSLPSWRRPAGQTGGVPTFTVTRTPRRSSCRRGRFHLDGQEIEASAGDVVVVKPGQVHGFRAIGDERLQMVAIHAASSFQTSWVEH